MDLIIENSGGSPERSAAAASKLVLVDKVDALIAADVSAPTQVAATVAAGQERVTVAAFPQLSWPDDGFGGHGFASAGTDVSIAKRLAEGLAALRDIGDAFAAEKWVVYHNPQLDRQTADALSGVLQGLGLAAPLFLAHGDQLPDGVGAVIVTRTTTPEQFQALLGSSSGQAAQLILVDAGLMPLDSIAAQAAGRTIHAYTLYDPLREPLTTDLGGAFKKRFLERTGKQPPPVAALAATAVQIAAIALAKLGDGDVGELGESLLALSLEPGSLITPWGMTFENFVNVNAQPFIVRVSDGEIERLWPS